MSIPLKILPKTKTLKINQEKPKEKLKPKSSLNTFHTQLLTSFGCDTSGAIKDCVNFITTNNYILYPVGNIIIIREISFNDNDKDKLASIRHLSKQNNIFIHQLSPQSKKITSLNVSQDKNTFIIAEVLEDENKKLFATISVYYLGQFNLMNEKKLEPVRKIITDKYLNFNSLSLGEDNDYLCGVCYDIEKGIKRGIIYDLQVKKNFELNETLPVSLFDVEQNVDKITYNRKIVGTSGLNVLNFFYLYEGKERKIQMPIAKNKNFVDHCYLTKDKIITRKEEEIINNKILYIILTEVNEIYIIQGVERAIDKLSVFSSEVKNSLANIDTNLYRTDHLRIDNFIIRQYISNIFENEYSLATNMRLINQNNFCNGLIIGNKDGDLLFMEKNKIINWNSENKNIIVYKKLRLIHREIKSECTGICFNNDESILCLAFKNNEISYCDLKNSYESMKISNEYNLKFHVLCEGYHHSPITSMDISSQRNIIVTSSNKDSSIKIWNYFNGLSEYCSLIFSEEKHENKQIIKNFNILALALHPTGYYLALSNQIMIWFFFIYYKQLKFYGTEQISNVNNNKVFEQRINCHILKFSNGGQYLIAGNYENNIFVIDSYTRETLNNYKINIRGRINDIVISDDDIYIYVIYNNGHIYEINLMNGNNTLLVKQSNINFLKSFSYIDEQLIGGKNIKFYNLLLCGKDIVSEKYSITEISYTVELKRNDIDINYSNLTYITEQITCLLFIQSEKLQNSIIVLGTFDGKIIITKSPITEAEYKYKEFCIHKGRISKLIYSKETHLLFSCGDDGNIFIIAIQEIVGDEAFYESLIHNIGQISDLKDGGLGENVLIPSWEMDKIEKTKGKKNILEKEFEDVKKEILKKNENEISGILKDMKNKNNEELNKMMDKIRELELEMKRQNEENKDNYNYMINEVNKQQSDEFSLYEVASSDYEKEINILKKELQDMNQMYEEEIEDIEKEYKQKFYDIRRQFEKRTKEIKEEDEKIEKKYLEQKDDKNVFMTNLEVENELDNKNILLEQDKINDEYESKLKKLKQEIINLKKKRLELEEILEDKEKDMNTLKTKVYSLEQTSHYIKEQNNEINLEIKNLKEKIVELKKIIEKRKITSEFEEKLRIELYKKNVEINKKYQEIKKEYNIQKDNNRLLEFNINSVNTKAMIIEDGRGKAHLALSAAEKENIKLKKKSNQLKNLLEEILAKVYKSLQTINKNEVYKCGCELYKLFLTDEYKNTINRTSLDMDILYEFNIKIKGLENKLNLDKNHIKYLQENHNKYKKKMFKENSSLLSGCTNVTKKSVNLLKNVENLNSEIKNLEETKLNNSSSIIIPNSPSKNKKSNLSNSSKDLLPPISYSTLNKNKGGTFASENSSNVFNNEDSNQ
mgnify:CR=1 FL=1